MQSKTTQPYVSRLISIKNLDNGKFITIDSDTRPTPSTSQQQQQAVQVFHEVSLEPEVEPRIGQLQPQQLQQEPETTKMKKKDKPPIYKSIRYWVMLVTLICPIVATYSKNMINFTIVRMIDPNYIKHESRQPANVSIPYFDLDNSCPVDEATRSRLIAELATATQAAQESVGEKFAWDEQKQGLLKAAFSIGHIPFQISGSRLSESYSAHLVLTGSILVTGVCSLLAPFLATIHYSLFFVDLFIMGIVGSFTTPAMITLFTNWLTPGEKSIMLTFYLITSRLGNALTSSIVGCLFSADISWRYVFFSAASKNILVRESLAENKVVVEETEMKSTTIGNNNDTKDTTRLSKKKKSSPPWRAILTSVPVWSFVVTKFCVKLSGDTVQIELPTYLDRVMHYDASANGSVNSFNYIIFCGGCFLAGALSKVAVKKQPFGLSKTALRKIFQSFASFGVSLSLIGIAFGVCDNLITIICLASVFFVTTFGTGGEQQIPMDLSERYPGTIHAIGSTLAISGVIVPLIVGTYLKGHPADKERWQVIWLGASAVAFLGGLVFLLGADAKIQPFDSMINDDEDADEETEEGKANKKKSRDNDGFVEIDVVGKNFATVVVEVPPQASTSKGLGSGQL